MPTRRSASSCSRSARTPSTRPRSASCSRLRRSLAPEVEKLIESGRQAFRNEDLQSALDDWRLALLVDPENERTRAYISHAERQLENLERMRSEPEPPARAE